MSAGEPSRTVELLSLPSPCLPICSTNLPSMVNLRSCPSFLPLPAKPYEIVVVDENSMLALRPLEAFPGAAPVAEQIAGLVEYQYRRRGNAALGFGWVLLGRALAWRERGRPVHDPDAVMPVGGDAGDLSQNPFVRQRLRPERIDLKLRQRSSAVGMRRVGEERHRGDEPHAYDFHDLLPSATRSLPQPSIASVARLAIGLHRLDGHHSGHRFDGAGDLGRDLEAARKLHLDLGAFA